MGKKHSYNLAQGNSRPAPSAPSTDGAEGTGNGRGRRSWERTGQKELGRLESRDGPGCAESRGPQRAFASAEKLPCPPMRFGTRVGFSAGRDLWGRGDPTVSARRGRCAFAAALNRRGRCRGSRCPIKESGQVGGGERSNRRALATRVGPAAEGRSERRPLVPSKDPPRRARGRAAAGTPWPSAQETLRWSVGGSALPATSREVASPSLPRAAPSLLNQRREVWMWTQGTLEYPMDTGDASVP